ncbi:unnamed protein product [Darwinula stevensoni]|uniref:ER-bound oxygenase mpaB/mpaB'/Rubber oxygenase catalytic domain-containing protein n=1 Tax=Darwinula stevensoni TaxID=69355 RepID=A0A7R8X8S5_9CRUS|nr:unnamed protein product [Darwinula stevensoni]CAG0883710.1 unnamed protein product [Darwinula stevensoni]
MSLESNASNCRAKEKFLQIFEGRKFEMLRYDTIPSEKPDWYDHDQFLQGQDFYRRFSVGILFSKFMSLVLGLFFPRLLRPLMFTRRSERPLDALRRYTATGMHVFLWYTRDPWDPDSKSRKSLQEVTTMHRHIARMGETTQGRQKIQEAMANMDTDYLGAVEEALHCFQEDTSKLQVPDSEFFACLHSQLKEEEEAMELPTLSQFDLALTQMGFFGAPLLYPHRVGIHGATERDWEGFIMFWRTMGYLLGIDDKYNLCQDTVAETRELLQVCCGYFSWQVHVDCSLAATFMAFTVVEGHRKLNQGLRLKPLIVYASTIYDIKMEKTRKSMTWHEWFCYMKIWRFLRYGWNSDSAAADEQQFLHSEHSLKLGLAHN